jgi:hypothetical protein
MALAVTLFARISVWVAKKFMLVLLVGMRWHELTTEQFRDIGLAARIAFTAQNTGILAAVFGFGWLSVAMLLTIFGEN